jgi:two-component system LytT family sensor kinase
VPPTRDEYRWKCDQICATIQLAVVINGPRMSSDSTKSSARQFAVVLGAWTAVAIIEGLADYWLKASVGNAPDFWGVFRWPLIEQWIWACLTPVVFVLTARFPLARPHLARSFAVHVAAFLVLSMIHCVVADALGSPLAAPPPSYRGGLLALRFMEEVYSDIWMYWPLVCIRALIDSNSRSRRKEIEASRLQGLLASSQLALLRAQIQPHFLFNTLHSVTTLVRTDPAGAEDLIADLAEILRASFSELSSQEITVGQELELVDCYLRIQQRRFSDRLQVVHRIAPAVLDAALPPLVLQSLVENAVIHGIAPSNKAGEVEISIVREDGRLCLEVRDGGVGLPANFVPGLGITNTRLRLQRLYGENQSMVVSGAPGCGATASLSIPFRVLTSGAAGGGDDNENSNVYRGRRAACAA